MQIFFQVGLLLAVGWLGLANAAGLRAQASDDSSEPEEVVQFSAFSDKQSGFYIIAFGDGKSQKASLGVFELLGKEEVTIRHLHQVELVNLCHPADHVLCGAGRFFLTFDEGYMWSDIRKTENLLVIYDLMRKEHTALKYADVFKANFFPDRGETGAISRFDWRQHIGNPEQHFDANSMSFRVPLPVNPLKPEFHEVFIDLLSRRAEVQPAKRSVDLLRSNVLHESHRVNSSLPSRSYEIRVSQQSFGEVRLPKFIRFKNLRGHPELLFEINKTRLEYQSVAIDTWKEAPRSGKFRCPPP